MVRSQSDGHLTDLPRTHLTSADQPAQQGPAVAGKARPIVERQRPAPQAWIARDRIVRVDATQDRIFKLGIGELLRGTNELPGADSSAQLHAPHARRPGDVI